VVSRPSSTGGGGGGFACFFCRRVLYLVANLKVRPSDRPRRDRTLIPFSSGLTALPGLPDAHLSRRSPLRSAGIATSLGDKPGAHVAASGPHLLGRSPCCRGRPLALPLTLIINPLTPPRARGCAVPHAKPFLSFGPSASRRDSGAGFASSARAALPEARRSGCSKHGCHGMSPCLGSSGFPGLVPL